MRTIQAPGLQLNEIDRSGYQDDADNSIVETVSFIAGFADKGEDYSTKYINSINTFVNTFGYPKNEAERYFFNAAYEVFNRGGVLYATKLPYDNNTLNKYAYCTYKVNSELCVITEDSELSGLSTIDGTLTSYVQIDSYPLSTNGKSGLMEMSELDKYRTDSKVTVKNDIVFVDITRLKYLKDTTFSPDVREYVGILPVITTAANALYFQKYIENSLSTLSTYNSIGYILNSKTETSGNIMLSNLNNDTALSNKIAGFTLNLGSEKSGISEDLITLSKTAISYFPSISFKNGKLDTLNLKKIGVVVFKMFVDTANDGLISFTPVESFSGELKRTAVDPDTGASIFIDNIINTNSKYINCFSKVDIDEKASTYFIKNQTATSLGFYELDCDKNISTKESISKALDMVFENNKYYNTIDIDLVVDAGVSNIALFIKSVYSGEKGKFDFMVDNANKFKLTSESDITEWRKIVNKYDNFCKNVRKDCMFIADAPRPFCLEGNEKIIRTTNPGNTVEKSILPKLRWISGIVNSSYGTGYCNWFRQIDNYSKEYFWCPPSIKASGAYIYTDAYSNYWMAPAGMRRGIVSDDVIDVAFNPNNEEAGKLYLNNWNYAISYPINGIILEGLKTFLRDKTAFDRVNVRRLFLGLEKEVRYMSKFFTYEGITDYMMTRFVDTMTPIFERVKENEGIREYVIVCDSSNNTTQTIDNNELHCTIAVKPVKSLEFIIMNFIATNQGASVSEIANLNL